MLMNIYTSINVFSIIYMASIQMHPFSSEIDKIIHKE